MTKSHTSNGKLLNLKTTITDRQGFISTVVSLSLRKIKYINDLICQEVILVLCGILTKPHLDKIIKHIQIWSGNCDIKVPTGPRNRSHHAKQKFELIKNSFIEQQLQLPSSHRPANLLVHDVLRPFWFLPDERRSPPTRPQKKQKRISAIKLTLSRNLNRRQSQPGVACSLASRNRTVAYEKENMNGRKRKPKTLSADYRKENVKQAIAQEKCGECEEPSHVPLRCRLFSKCEMLRATCQATPTRANLCRRDVACEIFPFSNSNWILGRAPWGDSRMEAACN